MKNAANTIEDLLEVLAGLQGQAKMQIESSDATIMHSIARQSFKGTALTDRQYALMKEKLQAYRNQFTALDYEFDRAIDSLRQPLRQIDRSKYIKIVDYPENVVYESSDKGKYIKVRFPFSKKLIMLINDIQKRDGDYYHEKGSHSHFFRLTERNVYDILSAFKEKSFDIDQELVDLYKELAELESNKHEYVPGVYNGELRNIPDNAIAAIKDHAEPNNLLQYYDRRYLFGLKHFDSELEQILNLANPLTAKIAKRSSSKIIVKPSTHSLNDLMSSLYDLNRFPLLVVLNDSNAINMLSLMHRALKNIIPAEDISVMFRLDSNTGAEFNEFIRDNKLNNLVAKNTKVVYINSNKVPKPLVNSGWKPYTSLRFDSDHFKQAAKFVDGLDINIEYVEEPSYFGRYGLGKRYNLI